ncbi:MAG: helix-turn-helix transcriptional regulator [Clostridia bacterium]|nr:helix-turn-helix transcriptional regulator [Clostridia bacterium]
MNIGKNITAFRKDAGMTQEELAGQIGVSAQAVSKWETGVSMPDILLLPVIADVFGITVDEIYTGKKEQSEPNQIKHYSFNELPEMLYQQLLETDSYAWESNTEEERKEWLAKLKDNLANDNRCTHGFVGDRGGAVFSANDYTIIHRTFGTQKSLDILNSESAPKVLDVLMDGNVRKLFLHLLTNNRSKTLFTAVGVSKKVGITEEECKEALEKMSEIRLVGYHKADLGDEEALKVYSMFGESATALYACMIFRLAEQIGRNTWFYGYRGAYLPVDKD